MKYILIGFLFVAAKPFIACFFQIFVDTKILKWRVVFWFLIVSCKLNIDSFVEYENIFLGCILVLFIAYVGFEYFLLTEKGKHMSNIDNEQLKNIKRISPKINNFEN